MILKNEAVHIGDCLSSLRGHVDEIVVVDTGSTDATVEIAEAHGARVLREAWRGDFACSRNTGLGAATGEWILYIDADERLACPGPLPSLLPANGHAAARVRLRPMVRMTAYSELRLFLRDPRIRFEGIIHESIAAGVDRVCREDGVGVALLHDISLEHVGYEGDQSHKHARNLPMLERAIPLKPERVYLRYHLGATLNAIGRVDEARASLETGIALAARASEMYKRVEGTLCCQVLAGLEMEQGAPGRALAAAERGLELWPDQLALQWARARALVALSRAAEAIPLLEPLLRHDPHTFFDPHIAYERSLFGEDTLGLLGSAWFALGDNARAEDFFRRAAACAADPLEFEAKAAAAASRGAATARRS